jgi:hypothetical protein
VSWHQFLASRFVGRLPNLGRETSLGISVRAIQQQGPEHAEIHGFLEQSSGSSLPVVSEFVGVLNLETREITIDHPHLEATYHGRISENGRVMILRQGAQSKPIYLVHEETLAELT